jgi:two-component system sensor kinase FixL
VTGPRSELSFDRDRVAALLEKLERLAAGDTQTSLDISPAHDQLDAIAYGINVLADELRWVHARVTESERGRADALREELAHLGRVTMVDALTGSLAHEINQPLTAVAANADAALHLLEAQPPRLHELRKALAEIMADNRRVGDVLRRVRLLLKKGVTARELIEVNGIVGEVVKLAQGDAIGRRIVLDVDLASRVGPVMGDRIQIQQVVLNLLLNAFDAVQDRDNADRRVRLRTAQRGQSAVIEVTDRGSGLSDEALALVFEPFFTTKRNGLGLGLSISRQIIVAHGGTLDITRNTETGMTFAATLPIGVALEPVKQALPVARQAERP